VEFKDDWRAKVTIENMKENLEQIEEAMNSYEDVSHLVKKLANQANELLKLSK
jgi:hypothetical protein